MEHICANSKNSWEFNKLNAELKRWRRWQWSEYKLKIIKSIYIFQKLIKLGIEIIHKIN
jgi:hypothetical protein